MWIHPTFPQASFVLSVVTFYLLRADLNELPVLKGVLGDPNPDANSQKASYEGSSPRTGTASRERMGAQAQVTPWAWRKPTSENCMLNKGINMLNQDGLITSWCTMFDWWLHIYNRYTWFDLICYIIWYVLQVWYMYYTWWLCVKLADADLRQVLAGLGLEMEQLRLKLSCAVQWLCEAVTPCTDGLHTFSHCPTTSYCLSTSLKFWKIIWQWSIIIFYQSLLCFEIIFIRCSNFNMP